MLLLGSASSDCPVTDALARVIEGGACDGAPLVVRRARAFLTGENHNKGFRGARAAATGAPPYGISLFTPNKTRATTNLGRDGAPASTRLVIESVFANLKGRIRLEQHLEKTPAALAVPNR